MNQIEIKTFRDKQYKVKRDTWFHIDTDDKVIDVLTQYVNSKVRLRFFTGDVKTGKCWNDEYDVIGSVGRSMGPVKIPLLIHNSRSTGGGGLLTHCIIGIKTKDYWLYKHPTLDLGTWSAQAIDETSDLYAQGYGTEVLLNGEVHARFKRPTSLTRADRYIAFMKGERMAK